jgi:hypothetical protein
MSDLVRIKMTGFDFSLLLSDHSQKHQMGFITACSQEADSRGDPHTGSFWTLGANICDGEETKSWAGKLDCDMVSAA